MTQTTTQARTTVTATSSTQKLLTRIGAHGSREIAFLVTGSRGSSDAVALDAPALQPKEY